MDQQKRIRLRRELEEAAERNDIDKTVELTIKTTFFWTEAVTEVVDNYHELEAPQIIAALEMAAETVAETCPGSRVLANDLKDAFRQHVKAEQHWVREVGND